MSACNESDLSELASNELQYILPTPNDWVYSLREVSLSKRSFELNDQLRTRYYQLKNAGKPCNWPPNDDPHASLMFGWNPFVKYTLSNQHFYAHQLGVACQESPLINNCLAYVCRMYRKSHPETWERVKGEASFRACRMRPEDHLFSKVRRALTQLLPELRGKRVYDHQIFIEEDGWETIVKSFNFYLPMIAKWCLHSYTNFPEDWTGAEGEYTESSIFNSVKSVSVQALVIDTMSPAIIAAMNSEDSGDSDGDGEDEKENKPKKAKQPRQKKEKEEEHWLDNPDHVFDCYHDDE